MERKTAKKIPIQDLIKGTYIKRPGWEPSGILTKYGDTILYAGIKYHKKIFLIYILKIFFIEIVF